MTLLGTFRHRLLSNLPLSPFRPFMVELFTPPDLLKYPSLVIGPAPTVTSRRLPTAAHVRRTHRARIPWEDLRSHDRSPALSMTALVTTRRPPAKVCLHRPSSKRLSDRTRRLLVWNTKPVGLLPRASVEHGKPLSWHRALPAQHVMGG